jgi:hypothetical protein
VSELLTEDQGQSSCLALPLSVCWTAGGNWVCSLAESMKQIEGAIFSIGPDFQNL